jgi:hypothetical protein
MDMQRTFIRFKRNTKRYDDGCAETHEEFEMVVISNSSEQKATTSKFATKEKKPFRRKSGKTPRKAKLEKFRQLLKSFWGWCSANTTAIVIVVFVVLLYLDPNFKEFLTDENVIQLLKLVLGR